MQLSHAGTYTVVVSNSAGSATSAGAILTVQSPTPSGPSNDAFANRSRITGASVTVQGSNVGASREPGEPNHYGTRGGSSVWWTWTAPGSGEATIKTSGSNFDTLMAVYTGNSISTLSLQQNDDDSGGGQTSLVKFTAVQGVTYQIAVDG